MVSKPGVTLERHFHVLADELLDKLGDVEVYFPIHKRSVDLLVLKGQKQVGLRVVASRYFKRKALGNSHLGHSSHRIAEAELVGKGLKPDFYVILTYLPLVTKGKSVSLGYRFLLVPFSEVEKHVRLKEIDCSEYRFCFHFQRKNVWDENVTAVLSDPLSDYSKFLNAWDLIEQSLT